MYSDMVNHHPIVLSLWLVKIFNHWSLSSSYISFLSSEAETFPGQGVFPLKFSGVCAFSLCHRPGDHTQHFFFQRKNFVCFWFIDSSKQIRTCIPILFSKGSCKKKVLKTMEFSILVRTPPARRRYRGKKLNLYCRFLIFTH
jgi:hypothetical protein